MIKNNDFSTVPTILSPISALSITCQLAIHRS